MKQLEEIHENEFKIQKCKKKMQKNEKKSKKL